MQTERVTVLMAPEAKSAMAMRAAGMGLSTGEFVRLAVDNFAGDRGTEAELEALTAELQAALPKMERQFDAMRQAVNEARAAIDLALRASGARA
ncbi:hypothetical protein [Sandaracinobacteroides saxicola]|uniref:Uncharacterized protein n=1 Tax=Sandaracinobacteroides saxicola TaxID=2759707 RepID=A0A7G5IJQ0_9SPHN|nr:hypothetical protein [Sandaracinobacteroides saxicola]QMW23592.1 hypothetical protein H3309_03605 [Sandaracinobacteroides saxicola]